MEKEKLRLDKYLWAIRLYKTRSQAGDACDKGKIKHNRENAKPSRIVHIGDEFEVKTENKRWVIKVTGLLFKRVQYSEAIKYYEDITPAEELDRIKFQAAAFHTGKRMSKQGRP
ncbi:MAG: RNA-binding S4 domain-containing protein, partial [Ferruginibacter sp.]